MEITVDSNLEAKLTELAEGQHTTAAEYAAMLVNNHLRARMIDDMKQVIALEETTNLPTVKAAIEAVRLYTPPVVEPVEEVIIEDVGEIKLP